MEKKQIISLINKQVANWTVLYTKLHNFHWFVKGHHFFTLHEKFEELYNTADGYIDELAERILALDGRPAATLKEVLEIASVQEAEGNLSAEEMVQTLISDFQSLSSELAEGIEEAGNAGDGSTADLLTGIQEDIEKHAWMLKAYLG
ncbi:Dps family protein [Heyndrickxia acidicola]|uniref:DNA starvation/stationary phase protection protein n=1 Tax=Heyndrickxia acidicola TaxID=209389 RepID=A0ABU6MP39_9BACI|nr:DNA starvation/stationary phase protection protein [Heyndrickxia acidicola]MED1206069.1 DNA starvation/stationary phase protection protein [Heyndrickxia acidicola]